MASRIERAEAEVQRAIADATAIAKREGITLAAAEAELWTALLALGRALLALMLARATARSRPAIYEHDGARYALDATTGRNSKVGTLRQGEVLQGVWTPFGKRAAFSTRQQCPTTTARCWSSRSTAEARR